MEIEDQQPRKAIAGQDKVTWRAVATILAGFCVYMVIGAQLAWGNQSTYYASYFYYLSKSTKPVSLNDFYIV